MDGERKPIERVREHYQRMKAVRLPWEKRWRDIQCLVVPSRGRNLDGDSKRANTGELNDKRINGTTSRALKVLSSGIQSGVTSKARQWFMLGHPDPKINSDRMVREWYDEVQRVLEGLFRRTDFYSACLHTYEEMAAFGQGAIAILEHPEDVFYCRCFTVGTYWMGADQYGDIDTFFYREVLTARQMEQRYGKDSLPDSIKSELENGKLEEQHVIVVGVFRHPEVYGLEKSELRPVTSVHFLDDGERRESGSESFLKVAGYRMWPFMTPRWDVIDSDVYGMAPMYDVLADTKTLQEMESDILKGAAKIISPPMRAPSSMRRSGINSSPGALNFIDNSGTDGVAPLYQVPIDINAVQAKENLLIQDIKEGLYNSLFLALLMQDNPQMTAREVTERHEEKLLMLGPVLERIHGEFLDPVIKRVFGIAWEAGLIPDPPEELLPDVQTTVEYISILSQAQKAIGVNRIEQSVQFIGTLMAALPEARHLLKPYKIVSEYNEMIGTPSKMFATEEEYDAAVQAEQQQTQMAQEAQVAEPMANAAKAIGDADLANVQQLLGGSIGGPML